MIKDESYHNLNGHSYTYIEDEGRGGHVVGVASTSSSSTIPQGSSMRKKYKLKSMHPPLPMKDTSAKV